MEPVPSTFVVENHTDQTLDLVADTGTTQGAEPGGVSEYVMDECSTSRIVAKWPDGRTVAVLDEKHCEDQVWVVSGIDDAELVDDDD